MKDSDKFGIVLATYLIGAKPTWGDLSAQETYRLIQ
jgi:hypothetical protein